MSLSQQRGSTFFTLFCKFSLQGGNLGSGLRTFIVILLLLTVLHCTQKCNSNKGFGASILETSYYHVMRNHGFISIRYYKKFNLLIMESLKIKIYDDFFTLFSVRQETQFLVCMLVNFVMVFQFLDDRILYLSQSNIVFLR